MTLATITALINSKIRNKTPKVLKTEHADVEQAIVNEVFSSEIYESTNMPSLMTITEKFVSPMTTGINFNITLKKTGNICFVKFFVIQTNTTTIGGNITVAKILDSSYFPKNTYLNDVVYYQQIVSSYHTQGNLCYLDFRDDKINVRGQFTFQDKAIFEGYYLLND
jgi:hypothetical protein